MILKNKTNTDVKEFQPLLFIISVIVIVGFTIHLPDFIQLAKDYGKTPTLSFNQALKSNLPLLVYFYSESCLSCEKVKPIVEDVRYSYREKLNYIVVDILDKKNSLYTQLFKVTAVPSIYLFYPHKMKKVFIEPKMYLNKEILSTKISEFLTDTSKI